MKILSSQILQVFSLLHIDSKSCFVIASWLSRKEAVIPALPSASAQDLPGNM